MNGVYKIEPAHTAFAVTSADQVALAANAGRGYCLLQNDSDTDIYISLGVAAVAHTGILLVAAGGFYEMTPAANNVYPGSIHAIHVGAGNKNLMCLDGN